VNQKLFICLGLVAAGLVASVPARAQAGIPPYEILTIVRSTGLDPLTRPLRQGSTYVLRAADPYGEEVRVVVGAQRGQILSIRPVARVAVQPYEVPPPGYYEDPRYGPPRYMPGPGYYGPDARYDVQPSPPAYPRVLTAPRDGSAKPAAKPAPKAAAVIPKKPLAPPAPSETSAPATSASTPGDDTAKTEKRDAPATPASAVPPVQTLEK
jgi:hypothetical protein